MQFGCQSKLNVAADPAPVRSRRMGLDSGLEKTFFFASFPQHLSFSAGWFFHCQPWPDRLWKIQDGTGEVWSSEVVWKQWIDYIRGKKSQWMTRKEEKCSSTTTETHVRPAHFQSSGMSQTWTTVRFPPPSPIFFWLIGSSSSRIDQKGMTDVRGRTSITPSSKRKKNVLMCFVTCCASGKTFRVRKRGKVSGVGAHPPYSWTYRPDGCESSFSFDLRLTLTVFSSSVFHLFLLIYLFFDPVPGNN